MVELTYLRRSATHVEMINMFKDLHRVKNAMRNPYFTHKSIKAHLLWSVTTVLVTLKILFSTQVDTYMMPTEKLKVF